jgi:hypothetical protein
MKQEYYSKVQTKDKREIELFNCIPKDIAQHLGLNKSLFLKWTKDDDGIITVTKSHNKPTTKKPMTVDEWLAIITPHIPTEPPGKNPFEIYKEAGLTKKSISPIYVDRARRDLNLQSHEDPQTHKTLWYRLEPTSKTRRTVELKQMQLPER